MKTTEHQALEALWVFVHQRPGFDWRDYGRDGLKYYNQDRNGAYRDLVKFRRLYADTMVSAQAPAYLDWARHTAGQRLEWNGERWDYTAGQYWCVEYRAAAVRLLESVLAMLN